MKTRKKKIKISIGSLDESSQRFVETWHKVEQGRSVQSQEYLTFDNLEVLLRVLTPVRWTLLRILRRKGPMSIRALAKMLSRDYKNVHTDVRELKRVGLTEKDRNGKIRVPWDSILAEINLKAA